MSDMSNISKRLGLAIISHLKSDRTSLGQSDENIDEGLEVAIDCLERIYGEDGSSDNLMDIFKKTVEPARIPLPEQKAEAVLLKNSGNDFMKQQEYEKAIEAYSQAIAKDWQNAVYFCNRAAAYTSIGNNKQAILDCEEAIKIDSGYGKAYGRMGLAYMNESNYKKAKESYESALKLEPNNASYQTNLNRANEEIRSATGNQSTQGGGIPGMPGGLGGMDLGALLSNPAVQNMAQTLFQNPSVQNMFAGMANPTPPPAAGGAAPEPQPAAGATDPPPAASAPINPMSMFENMDFGSIMQATQGFAQQMQQTNPELCEQLRSQFQNGQNPPQPPPSSDGQQ